MDCQPLKLGQYDSLEEKTKFIWFCVNGKFLQFRYYNGSICWNCDNKLTIEAQSAASEIWKSPQHIQSVLQRQIGIWRSGVISCDS